LLSFPRQLRVWNWVSIRRNWFALFEVKLKIQNIFFRDCNFLITREPAWGALGERDGCASLDHPAVTSPLPSLCKNHRTHLTLVPCSSLQNFCP
jgi:hypothetical protein